MRLDHIALCDFRNISAAQIDFSPESNVLLGENAQGKTNLVEAIYLLACGKSFRVPRLTDMIAHGKKRAQVIIEISGEGLPFQLKMQLDEKEGKSIYKNGVRLTRLSDFLGLFRVVLFCPEHLSLVKDGPGKRRSFVDGAICQLRPYYASLLNECNKIESQRAALLKQSQKTEVSQDFFRVWEERLAQVSAKIASIRANYIHHLSEMAPRHFFHISGEKEKLSIRYVSDVYREGKSQEEMAREYQKTLLESFSQDQKYGSTQKGIHRDEVEFLVNGFPARTFASQGQQRSVVLSLKLAEGEISKEMTGQDPVYLLDDVLSELDEHRRKYITSGLVGKQVILTGTDPENFTFVKNRILVENGAFFR